MNKELLKQVLIEQRKNVLNKKTGVTREVLDEVKNKANLPHVHVITGMRRAGKSILLRQIINELYEDNHFFYVNFEDERFYDFKAENFSQIHETLIGIFGDQKVFFIDEVQNIAGFELFVRRLSEEGYKFYLTGSNANLLSQEISSRLTGRHVDTRLWPFGFIEFLEFNKVSFSPNDIYVTEKRVLFQQLFDEFFQSGGMPEYLSYRDDEILIRIYEDILAKDVAIRYKITNIFQLRQLYSTLISNFSSRFSFRSLQKGTEISSNSTVKNYLDYLVNTNFGSMISGFDHSVNKQWASQKKFYLTDHAFIPMISTRLTKDTGHILENIVFNELAKKSEIFYFSGANECDFVSIKHQRNPEVFQVCYDLNDQNHKREVSGLTEAMNYLGIKSGKILTMWQESEIVTGDVKIAVIPVWKWILQNKE